MESKMGGKMESNMGGRGAESEPVGWAGAAGRRRQAQAMMQPATWQAPPQLHGAASQLASPRCMQATTPCPCPAHPPAILAAAGGAIRCSRASTAASTLSAQL